jgi:glycosyltransferase involved in cell wall biosynthesis
VTQVLAVLVSLFTGVPYMTTCHGFFKPRLSRRIFPCWGKAVIAISEQVCDHLINDFKYPENKIVIVPHGLEEKKEVWSEKQKQDRRRILQLNFGAIIGMVARLSDVKGQDILIKAMAQVAEKFKDVNLVLVGEGKFKDTLLSLVKELSLERNVFFLPIINDQQNILPLFDIFVMPSRQEGLGLSVMEAQAHGVCVIASDVGGLPTLVQDGKTGVLFPREDVDRLAMVIIRLIESPEKRNELGKAGQEFIRTNFPFEQMINKTIDVYVRVGKNE